MEPIKGAGAASEAEDTGPQSAREEAPTPKPVQKKPETRAPKESVDRKQDPDEVPMEIVEPEEEEESKEKKPDDAARDKTTEDKKDKGGQYTLEW